MLKRLIKTKDKNSIFLCQITENYLKVIKCLLANGFKREFVGLEVEAIPPDINDKKLVERLKQIFSKLRYQNNHIIVSLPRSLATCRYLKIPSQHPKEIERIVNLQASHYLPYPAEELITGYQLIRVDKQGYSDVNLIIAHKDIIGQYINIFKELKNKKLTVVLSSYGICNFYSYIKTAEESGAVLIIDIDSHQVEIAITSHKRLLFSRSFKLTKLQPNWQNLFIDEVNKTRDAYLKEASKEALGKIIILGSSRIHQEFAKALSRQTDLPVEVLSYGDKIKISNNLLNSVLNSDTSFTSLIGLGLEEIGESLNLLPQELKEETRRMFRKKECLKVIFIIFGIILLWAVGIAKNLDNRTMYLKQLDIELNKIEKEAKPLEEIEKRLQWFEDRLQKRLSTLDILYELCQSIPHQVSLVSFTYEEDNQVIFRGQTPELNSVFEFVTQLEKSPVYKNFNIKIRYATQKKSQAGEIVDFEIACMKK